MGINTLGWDRVELIELPHASKSDDENSQYGLYRGGSGAARIQPLLTTSFEPARISEVREGTWMLSNSQYRVIVFQGNITSLYDIRADREVVARDSIANQLILFDDMPLYHQAWDVETYHLALGRELEGGMSTVSERGPYRVSITTSTRISESSSIETTVSLAAVVDPAQESHVECLAEVEWHETMKFLKVQFPVDVCNTHASYETQFGIVERPTHYNTSWDMAKFEVCSHKWADLSESTYGVSIFNDSKYGFATSGNMMRLSLLRSPKAPDANADMGRHRIRWGIFPHQGSIGWQTIRKAFEFNVPILMASDPHYTDSDRIMCPVRLKGGVGLILDTVKRAEDDDDVSRGELPVRKGKSIVCRVYDALGGKNRAFLDAGRVKINSAWKCNILEDDLQQIPVVDNGIHIELQRFEIATYRLQLE